MVKKLLFHLSGVAVVFVLLSALLLWYAVNQYHNNAHQFWGESYDPSASRNSPFEFPLSYIIPTGGGTIASDLAGCVNTPIPMVPVKFIEGDNFLVLCGIVDTTIEERNIGDIKDEQIRDVLREFSSKGNEL